MLFFTLTAVALGLSMDAFTVAISYGCEGSHLRLGNSFIIALFFGGFQMGMPLIGWVIGSFFEQYIRSFDHWIAFGLLALIGGKMIYEYFSRDPEEEKAQCGADVAISYKKLLLLSVATSIDALAVGLSFSILDYPVLASAALIGVITFIMSFIGVRAGCYLHYRIGKKMELAGGFILIGIGLKILIEHLLRG